MIKQWIVHFEWNRGYRWLPQLLITPKIKHGQIGTDGGQVGHFIYCETCSGAGTLFVPAEVRSYDSIESPENLELDYTLGTKPYKGGELVWTRKAEYVVDGIYGKTLFLVRKDVWEKQNKS